MTNVYHISTFWTEQRTAQLARYWQQGKTASEIAGLLGSECTRNGVIGKAHRLGLSSRPSPIIRRQVILIHNLKTCEYPIGEPREPGFRFCGQPQHGNSPYCEAHYSICYTKKLRLSDDERQRRAEWGRKLALRLNRQRVLAAAQRQV